MSKLFLAALVLCIFGGCKEKYEPQIKSANQSILVVEGNLDPFDTTTIRLTRTISINDSPRRKPEVGASLTIEGKDNSVYALIEREAGVYTIFPGHGNIGQDYRLHIITSSGKEYLSDYVTIKSNPPIDSINWVRGNAGVTINVNTHDPEGKASYYRWEYDETFEIHSFYVARWKYTNGSIVPRDPSDNVYTCYKSSQSSNIFLGTSTKLLSDVIYQNPIIFIPNGSEKLAVRYSILVRQYVLSQEAYNYFQILKKNTEALGTIFDYQPTDVNGNIHSVADPGERVIGFLTSSPVQQERIFINSTDIPGWLFSPACSSIYVENKPELLKPIVDNYMVYDANVSGIVILGYYFSDPSCVDCTQRGGSLTKPSFW